MANISLEDVQKDFGLTIEEKDKIQSEILKTLKPKWDKAPSSFEQALDSANRSGSHRKEVWSTEQKQTVPIRMMHLGKDSHEERYGLEKETYKGKDSIQGDKVAEVAEVPAHPPFLLHENETGDDNEIIKRYMLVKNIQLSFKKTDAYYPQIVLYEGHDEDPLVVFYDDICYDEDLIITIETERFNFPLDLTLVVRPTRIDKPFVKQGVFSNANTKRLVIDLSNEYFEIEEKEKEKEDTVPLIDPEDTLPSTLIGSNGSGDELVLVRNDDAVSLNKVAADSIEDLDTHIETEVKKLIAGETITSVVKEQLKQEVMKELLEEIVGTRVTDLQDDVDLLKRDIECGIVKDLTFNNLDITRIQTELGTSDIQVYDALRDLVRERTFPGTLAPIYGEINMSKIKQDLINEDYTRTTDSIEEAIKKLIRGKLREDSNAI